MRKTAQSIGLALIAVMAFSIAPQRVAAKDKRTEVVYAFPSTISGVEFGQSALVSYVKKEALKGERVIERAFDGMPLLFMSDMLDRLPSAEATALNKEVEDADLVSIANSAGSNFDKGKKLDDKRVSSRDLVRGLGKVVEEFTGNEAAALLLHMGYNESWILNRLKSSDTTKKNFEELERAYKRDIEKPSRLWKDAVGRGSYADAVDHWLALASAPNKAQLVALFEEEDAKLTPEIWRIVRFGDAKMAADAFDAAGVKQSAFVNMVEDSLRDLERKDQGSAQGKAILGHLERKAFAQVRWLSEARTDLKGVYQVSVQRGEGLHLNAFSDGSWKKAKDKGISDSLLNATNTGNGWRMVVRKNGSVRLLSGHRRYEGKYDAKAKTITLTSRSGFGDEQLKKVEFLADGLLAKAEKSRGTKPGVNVLLKRVPAFR